MTLTTILLLALAVAKVIFWAAWYVRKQRRAARNAVLLEAFQDTMKRRKKGDVAVLDLRGSSRDDYIGSLRRDEGKWK